MILCLVDKMFDAGQPTKLADGLVLEELQADSLRGESLPCKLPCSVRQRPSCPVNSRSGRASSNQVCVQKVRPSALWRAP